MDGNNARVEATGLEVGTDFFSTDLAELQITNGGQFLVGIGVGRAQVGVGALGKAFVGTTLPSSSLSFWRIEKELQVGLLGIVEVNDGGRIVVGNEREDVSTAGSDQTVTITPSGSLTGDGRIKANVANLGGVFAFEGSVVSVF